MAFLSSMLSKESRWRSPPKGLILTQETPSARMWSKIIEEGEGAMATSITLRFRSSSGSGFFFPLIHKYCSPSISPISISSLTPSVASPSTFELMILFELISRIRFCGRGSRIWLGIRLSYFVSEDGSGDFWWGLSCGWYLGFVVGF